LSSAPAWIAKDVDVGRPVVEARRAARRCSRRDLLHWRPALRLVILRARFGGDGIADAVNQVRVPRGAKRNRLREHGRAAGSHAMQRLIPPVVDRNAEPRNGRRDILHLQNFFFESHAADEVGGALLGRQARILVWSGRLAEQRKGADGNQSKREIERLQSRSPEGEVKFITFWTV